MYYCYRLKNVYQSTKENKMDTLWLFYIVGYFDFLARRYFFNLMERCLQVLTSIENCIT